MCQILLQMEPVISRINTLFLWIKSHELLRPNFAESDFHPVVPWKVLSPGMCGSRRLSSLTHRQAPGSWGTLPVPLGERCPARCSPTGKRRSCQGGAVFPRGETFWTAFVCVKLGERDLRLTARKGGNPNHAGISRRDCMRGSRRKRQASWARQEMPVWYLVLPCPMD